MSYLRPSGVSTITGACAFDDGFCAWSGRTAFRWTPDAGGSALSDAPAALDSGFAVQSGVLAGAGTHVGFLPAGGDDWAWWADLSAYSDAAHPMYGDLLLCPDHPARTYTLFSVTADGLGEVSRFGADELATPLAGWSSPTNVDRLLLIGEDGLWALDPPYTADALQPLVSFDRVDLPAPDDIPGPFQPGPATVVVPRRSRSALRLDLSDGTGHDTGLAHLPGGAALWTAYLRDDRPAAERVLAALAALPAPPDDSLRLHDVLMDGGQVRAIATSAGVLVPEAPEGVAEDATRVERLRSSPLDTAALVSWALWLGWDGAPRAAGRRLCAAAATDWALVDALDTFGDDAVATLFDLLRSADPPEGPDGDYGYPAAALRALAARTGTDRSEAVAAALADAPVPVRVAACVMAGATAADATPGDGDAASGDPVLWGDDRPVPTEALRANTKHDHPAVRAAAQEACARLAIELRSSPPAPSSSPNSDSSLHARE
jgi:hypothetical protein